MNCCRLYVAGCKLVKGQTFLITVLILSSVVLVSLNWGTISVLKMRGATGASDSVKAFYAADSGIECYLFNLFKTPPSGTELPIACNSDGKMTNETAYSIVSRSNSVAVIGSVKNSGIQRALEVSF